jgi:acyl-CoA reductase-like NAD-dependent aldehyde dehydrogenase
MKKDALNEIARMSGIQIQEKRNHARAEVVAAYQNLVSKMKEAIKVATKAEETWDAMSVDEFNELLRNAYQGMDEHLEFVKELTGHIEIFIDQAQEQS